MPAAVPVEKIDAQAVKATVAAVHNELGAVFYTNKEKINEALRGKSPQEIDAIRKEYQEHYGTNLDSEVHHQLSGKSLVEAEAALRGDRAQSYATALHNAGGLLAGKGHIESLLTQVNAIQDVAERNRVRAQLKEQFGAQYAAVKAAAPTDQEARKLVALVDGDQVAVESLKLAEKVHGGWGGKGGFLGLGLGMDKGAVIESLEQTKDPAERQELLRKYQEQTGHNLESELASRLKGSSAKLAQAVIHGDEEGAAAARIHAAAEGFWGTDKATIFHQLEGSSTGPDGRPLSKEQLKDRQAKIIAKFNQQAAGGNPKAFDTMVGREMNGLDAARLHELQEKGKVSDELALKYAMQGNFFSDKGALKKVLEGKSRADIDKLVAAYKGAGYGDLKAALAQATDQHGILGGGRDGFEIQELLKGTPKTAQERLARAQEAYEFERGAGAGVIGRGLMDLVSHSGRDLDREHGRILSLQEKIKNNGGHPTDEDMQELIKLTGYQHEDVKAYQESKDAAANSAAMGAALVVGTVATVATGGAAGPATAAVVGSLAGGAASMATKMTIQGAGYSTADLKADLLETGMSALTAGVGQSGKMLRGMDKLLKIGPAGGGMLKEAAKGALLGTTGGLVSGAASQLDNAQNYLGEGAFLGKLASGVGRTALSSALGGGLGGGFGSSTLGRSGLAQNHQMAFAGLSGAVGGLGSGLSGALTGDGFGLESLQGVLSGAVSGVGSAHQMLAHHQALAQQQHGPLSHFAEPDTMPMRFGPEHPSLVLPAVAAEHVATGPEHQAPQAAERMPHRPVNPESPFGTTTGDKTSAQAGHADFRQAANPEQVQQRAKAQLQRLSPEHQKQVMGLVQQAENHGQLVMLERAVAAGSSASEIHHLFASMRGLSEVEVLRGFTGAGIFQYFRDSCVPTSFQIAIAEMNPVYALRLSENPTGRAQQQHKHLTEGGGIAKSRIDYHFNSSPDMLEHMFRNPEMENFVNTASANALNENGQPATTGRGMNPNHMHGTELHQLLEKSSGHKYELHSVEDVTAKMPHSKRSFRQGELDHAHIQAALERGLPVPFSQGGHEQVITGVHRNPDGSVYYFVGDPHDGLTSLVAQERFGQTGKKSVATMNLPNLEAARIGVPHEASAAPAPAAAE